MLDVAVDRGAISRLGMDARDVLDAVETLGGRPAGEVLVGQRRFALQVRFPEAVRADPEAVEGAVANPYAFVHRRVEWSDADVGSPSRPGPGASMSRTRDATSADTAMICSGCSS